MCFAMARCLEVLFLVLRRSLIWLLCPNMMVASDDDDDRDGLNPVMTIVLEDARPNGNLFLYAYIMDPREGEPFDT